MSIRQSHLSPRAQNPAISVPKESQKQGFSFIGQCLADAREAKGLTIRQATEVTGITCSNLQLLEAGKLHENLAPAYVKGYIKCYAKAIQAPLDELLQAYQSGVEQRQSCLQADYGSTRRNRHMARVAMAFAGILVLVLGYHFIAPAQGSLRNSATEPVTTVSVLSSPSQLLVLPSLDSWLEITDSQGNILKADLVPAGAQFMVEGEPPFNLAVGHGGEVIVNYLDQSIHLAADSGDNSARLVLGD